jgi:hypothetical protein
MATAHMFRRLRVATVSGQAYSCCWGTNWSGHSSQGQVSLVSLMSQGDQRAHGTIPPTSNHQRAGYRPRAEHEPGTGVRDTAAWWPLSSCCQCGGMLAMSAPTLSVSVIVLSLSTGACWTPRRLARVAGRGLLIREVSPTGAPGPSCCCDKK